MFEKLALTMVLIWILFSWIHRSFDDSGPGQGHRHR